MRRRRTDAAPRILIVGALVAAALAGCTPSADQNGDAVPGVIPAPVRFELRADAAPFRITAESRILVAAPGGRSAVDESAAVAERFAVSLRRATGFELPVEAGSADADDTGPAASDLVFVVAEGEAPGDAAEGYTLEAGADGLRLTASTAEGLFRGTQTLRQLLPVEVDAAGSPASTGPGRQTAESSRQDIEVPAASIADAPRFAYRGAMLDVARHFMPVDDVLRFLDAIVLLKLNVLHLHLTDDQGWRIEIESWPELTGIGASTSVGGDGGGFYTKADYRRIVAYAAERYVTIVPEIDLPGHTNAALSAYPELNADGVAPAPYEGIGVGFSSLSAAPERAEATDRFLADVTREVAELTPGPWLHLGGDESLATSTGDYLDLLRRVTAAGAATGKTIIGWHEMGASRELPPGTVGQYWSFVEPEGDAVELTGSFVEQGGRVILSPADVAYLDMKYVDDPQNALGHTLGLEWAKGPTTLDEAYLWEPTAIMPGLDERHLLGIEAPIWTETLRSLDDVEFMAFPRILAIAEIAWSPAPDAGATRDVDGFFARVATLGLRLDALGIEYYAVRGVPWLN
jgi:hexosaminidase